MIENSPQPDVSLHGVPLEMGRADLYEPRGMRKKRG